MKKTLLTALTLMVMITMTAAANGVQENSTTSTWGAGYGRYAAPGTTGRSAGPVTLGEEKTFTGKLKLEDNNRAELVTGDETYELMYPYYYTYNLDIKDGQEITVKGYDVPAYRWSPDGDDKHIRVTEATIDGKTYELDNSYGRMGGNTKGNRGRGSRMNTGPGNWNNQSYGGRGRR